MQEILEILQEFWSSLQQGHLPEMGPWNYVLLAILIVWQGPIATLLGGAAASAGLLRPGLVFISGVIGNLTADIIWYNVGRRGNVAQWFEKGRLLSQRPRFLSFQNAMRRHATKILIMAKLSAGFAVPALLAAGLTKLRWRQWFPVVFLGETIWTGTLVLIGFYATEAIKQVERGIQLIFAVIAFILLLAVVWFIPRLLRDNTLNAPQPDEKKSP